MSSPCSKLFSNDFKQTLSLLLFTISKRDTDKREKKNVGQSWLLLTDQKVNHPGYRNIYEEQDELVKDHVTWRKGLHMITVSNER